jgi:hypothetical protein
VLSVTVNMTLTAAFQRISAAVTAFLTVWLPTIRRLVV